MIPYRHTDGRTLLLGKLPAKYDRRRLRLKDYLPKVTPPPSANWYKGVTEFGAMLNNSLGDCTCAAVGHAEQVVTLNIPFGEIVPSDQSIENLYEGSCGYVPGDPSTDNGGYIPDVLNYVRKYKWFTHKHPPLYAYCDTEPGDVDHIKQGIATFSVVDIGLQLPITAQNQVGSLWTVVGNPNDPSSDAYPGSWGGHSVVVSAYDANTLTCVTWGGLQAMDWNFWQTYVDESHCLLLRLWLQHFAAGSGVDFASLDAALQALND